MQVEEKKKRILRMYTQILVQNWSHFLDIACQYINFTRITEIELAIRNLVGALEIVFDHLPLFLLRSFSIPTFIESLGL